MSTLSNKNEDTTSINTAERASSQQVLEFFRGDQKCPCGTHDRCICGFEEYSKSEATNSDTEFR